MRHVVRNHGLDYDDLAPGESPAERDRRVHGHFCLVTDAYSPKGYCGSCREPWPCSTKEAEYAWLQTEKLRALEADRNEGDKA